MKQTLRSILVSLTAFALGFGVHFLSKVTMDPNENSASTALASSGQSPCSQSDVAAVISEESPLSQSDDFPNLVDDQNITKFNGVRLDLDYGPRADEIPFSVEGAKIIGLDDGSLLVNLDDTLYKLDSRRRVVWTYQTAQIIFDYAYVKSSNLIYGTAGDNIMFVLDATTGKFKTGESRNGSAAFGVAANYGTDMCLVTDNLGIYRERARGAGIEPMNDGMGLWRGTKKLWSVDFPPDAELVVAGKRILAVTKSKKAIYVNEIKPPPAQHN